MPCSRRFALAILAALVAAAPAYGATRDQGALTRKLDRALAVPHVDPARAAALAVDLGTGRVVYARNPALALAPASTEKLPLTFALLTALGPSFRIQTDVLGDGEQRGAVWHGDLILQGHGDPTLSRGDLARLAAQVRATGIRQVSGRILGDESWFDRRRMAPGWKASYYVNESPPLSALIVDRGWYRGFLPREPAAAAALAFRDALAGAGVSVSGRAIAGRAGDYAFPIGSVSSPQLASLVRFMDRQSDNFTAEMLLKELGAVATGRGTTAGGAQIVLRQLAAAGVPLEGCRIVDGSGLSRLDRLTANALVAILGASWGNASLRAQVLAALPVAGISGTLEDRMRRAPARGNVVAKTGTTSDASALAGYVRGRYVFAVVQNGHPVSYSWARRAQDRFATVLAAE